VFQQDSPETPAQRREVVVATLATTLHRWHRWHRQQIRAGARIRRGASMPAGEHPQPESSRLDCAEDDRTDRPLPPDLGTAVPPVAGGSDGDQSWR